MTTTHAESQLWRDTFVQALSVARECQDASARAEAMPPERVVSWATHVADHAVVRYRDRFPNDFPNIQLLQRGVKDMK